MALSVRDWFAAQALTGLLAKGDRLGDAETTARSAYFHAEAMLEERARWLGNQEPASQEAVS